jgi:UDPglucose 6-dehydrogenase
VNIAVVGTGYVGLVSGACFAEVGHNVVCMDRDQAKIAFLKQGGIPIYEEGLEPIVFRNVAASRLRFTDSLADALKGAEVVFLAIGTPQGEDGSADLSMVLQASEQIGASMTASLILVQKSTCPVGTARELDGRVRRGQEARGVEIPFSVVSNPEFLREGNAVRDFMAPDRVVIGADDEGAGRRIASLYEKIAPPERVLVMDRASAELTKYAANAFLATKISFINDIANLCELLGADVENVRRGIGSDTRIGPAFLAAGIGYGGSCFPKDVTALVKTSTDHACTLRIVEAAEGVNRDQWKRQVAKVVSYFGGSLAGRRMAILGVAFKPGTDDMREAPAIAVTHDLIEYGAEVWAYDPIAMDNARLVMDARVQYATNLANCLAQADAVILMTEWPEFRDMDLAAVGASVKRRVLFDFRNAIVPANAAAAGFEYFGVGRAAGASALAMAGQ